MFGQNKVDDTVCPAQFLHVYVRSGEPHVLCSETLARQSFDTNGVGRTPMINNICGRKKKSQTSTQTNNTTRQHVQPGHESKARHPRYKSHIYLHCRVHFLFFHSMCGWCCKGKSTMAKK
jgi:hypothetical protein